MNKFIEKYELMPIIVYVLSANGFALSILYLIQGAQGYPYSVHFDYGLGTFLISTIIFFILLIAFSSGDKKVSRNKSNIVNLAIAVPILITMFVLALELRLPFYIYVIVTLIIDVFLIYKYVKYYDDLYPLNKLEDKSFSKYGIFLELLYIFLLGGSFYALLDMNFIYLGFLGIAFFAFLEVLERFRIKTLIDYDKHYVRLLPMALVIFINYARLRLDNPKLYFLIFFAAIVLIYLIYRQLVLTKKAEVQVNE